MLAPSVRSCSSTAALSSARFYRDKRPLSASAFEKRPRFVAWWGYLRPLFLSRERPRRVAYRRLRRFSRRRAPTRPAEDHELAERV